MSFEQLLGEWSYRAFLNDVDIDTPFNDLRFATAKLVLESGGPGALTGLLSGEGWGTWTQWALALEGSFDGGEFLLRGTNRIDGEDWVYDYRGRLLPQWGHAADARDVLTGSVIRTGARQKHEAAAGVHATFIAVKRR